MCKWQPTVGNISKGHNGPRHPLLPRAFCHPREAQHQNKHFPRIANIKVFYCWQIHTLESGCDEKHKGWVLSSQEFQYGPPVSGRNHGLQVGGPGMTGRDETSIFAADKVTKGGQCTWDTSIGKGSALRGAPKAGSGGIHVCSENCAWESRPHIQLTLIFWAGTGLIVN